MTYATIAVFLSAAVATVAGVASWGFHPSSRSREPSSRRPKALLLVFAANACYLIPLFTVVGIGVLLSTATRNSTAAVVGTVGFVILLYIVAGIPGLEGIKPYLLTEQFQNWHGLLRTPTDWAPITHSPWVCALYAVPRLARAATWCSCAATSPAAEPRAQLDLARGSSTQLDQLDLADQPPRLARVDQPGAEPPCGLGPAGDAEAQALVGRAAFVARRHVAGEEGIAGAALGDRLARLDRARASGASWPSTSTWAKQPSGSVMIASRGPSARDLAHRQRALLLAGELVADELLGLQHVRRDDVGLGADRVAQRLAVGVDHRRDLHPLQSRISDA